MGPAPDIRPPAVAGRFYPEDPAELSGLVKELLKQVPAQIRPVPGAMVPHAGLVYSGACAARVLGGLALPASVVVLAPNHSGEGVPGLASLWPTGGFQTPLGIVPIAEALAGRLGSVSDLVGDDRRAHRLEHAIEVVLPFLQVLAPGVTIVPLVVPWDDWPRSRRLAQALASLIAAWPERVLLLASSDLSHYERTAVAARKDAMALGHIERLDGEGLLSACHAQHITMCGRAPVAVVAEATRLLGATRGTIVDYRHSGLVNGDNERVVGYAGVIME